MEHRLIELYRDERTLDRLILRTRGTPDLRARIHLVERARCHYFRDEFDTCTLLLVTIMDGFVNDFEPANRKGLHAREADEMAAWDSVTGHHLGLTHVLRETFLKTIKKRQDDEVFDVYRHGIVHGSSVNYNNVVAATKAWNMLFAVQDWAKATEKFQEPREELPTSSREVWSSLKESVDRYQRVQDDKQKVNAWAASTLTAADDGFDDHFMKARSEDFLSAWQSANYGRMGQYVSCMFRPERTNGGWAGEARQWFSSFELIGFDITELENSAYAVWIARGTAIVNRENVALTLRWVLQTPEGSIPIGEAEVDANWWLPNFNPQSMLDPTPSMPLG